MEKFRKLLVQAEKKLKRKLAQSRYIHDLLKEAARMERGIKRKDTLRSITGTASWNFLQRSLGESASIG